MTKVVLSGFGIKTHFEMLSLCHSKNDGAPERTRKWQKGGGGSMFAENRFVEHDGGPLRPCPGGCSKMLT